jgi:hypothetical protein
MEKEMLIAEENTYTPPDGGVCDIETVIEIPKECCGENGDHPCGDACKCDPNNETDSCGCGGVEYQQEQIGGFDMPTLSKVEVDVAVPLTIPKVSNEASMMAYLQMLTNGNVDYTETGFTVNISKKNIPVDLGLHAITAQEEWFDINQPGSFVICPLIVEDVTANVELNVEKDCRIFKGCKLVNRVLNFNDTAEFLVIEFTNTSIEINNDFGVDIVEKLKVGKMDVETIDGGNIVTESKENYPTITASMSFGSILIDFNKLDIEKIQSQRQLLIEDNYNYLLKVMKSLMGIIESRVVIPNVQNEVRFLFKEYGFQTQRLWQENISPDNNTIIMCMDAMTLLNTIRCIIDLPQYKKA